MDIHIFAVSSASVTPSCAPSTSTTETLQDTVTIENLGFFPFILVSSFVMC